ncbi:hypothetical protein AAG570_000720 [Ranatra chinensis]|uniref:Peptidase M14 domain-containing protein n=1 Tax=Ranatra chinensis TaxID=642074 RepID=A0ABD0YXY0_9HEMI
MKLCAANKSQLGVPNVKLIGNMHGNEPVGREMIINMIQYLIDGYRGGDEEIVGLVSTTKVHLMPSLNPDGYRMAVEGYCTRGPGRDNGRGKDLNRDFPTRLDWNNSDEQPETSAVRRWMSSVQFVLSASLHSGALVVSYPFDAPTEHHCLEDMGECLVAGSWRATTESITGDDDVFRHLATLYSNNNPRIPLGCGQHEKFNNGIINGALWYPTTGSMQDYNYLFHGCLELTLQISCCKYPFAHMLEAIWHENHRALIKLMGEVQRGVKGVVREKASGRSLAGARVSLEGTNRATTNTTPIGEYWKILLPGKYSLKVSMHRMILAVLLIVCSSSPIDVFK